MARRLVFLWKFGKFARFRAPGMTEIVIWGPLGKIAPCLLPNCHFGSMFNGKQTFPTAGGAKMAGRPVLRQLGHEIEARAKEAGVTGDEYIMNQIVGGRTINAIAADFGVSRNTLYAWRDRGGEERKNGWALAMELSADGLAEEGMEILDELADPDRRLPPENSEVTLARARSDYRQWLASMRNRARYGKAAEASVHVHIGDGHLAELRARAETRRISAAPVVEDGDEDYSIVETSPEGE